MLKNYIVTALRNFRKNAAYTLLNIGGLALGLACCLVVFTIIDFEYSFDNWHNKKENIYRVTRIYHGDNGTGHRGIIPYPSGKVLREEVPDLINVVEFDGPGEGRISFVDDKDQVQVFREFGLLSTTKEFFDVLDFELLSGNPEDLNTPNKIFLQRDLAEKYFGEEDPIGKALKLNGQFDLYVAGVMENTPDNTNLPFKALISLPTLRQIRPTVWDNWLLTSAYSIYVELAPGTDIQKLNVKIDDVFDAHANPDDAEERAKTEISLQPVQHIHTDERYGDGTNYVTPSIVIWAFIFLGVLILGTACLNFVNLSTAQAIKRSKEVGIRKTVGSSKLQLKVQFLTETFVIVIISMLLALSIGQFLLDQLHVLLEMVGYQLPYTQNTFLFGFGLSFIITLLAGIYPSMVLSNYQPVEALKNKVTIGKGSGSFNLRRSLVVAQFAFTTILLIGALIIAAQVNFMKTKDLGFDFSNVVLIETPGESDVDPNLLMEELLTKSYVQDASLAFTPPQANSNWNTSYKLPGQPRVDGNNSGMKFIDDNYLAFYDIPLIAGENLKDNYLNDSTYEVVVTRSLPSSLGWDSTDDAIGRVFESIGGTRYRVVGVVEDFNVNSVQSQNKPCMLMYRPDQMNQIALKLPNENAIDYVSEIEATFREFYPEALFEFKVLRNEIEDFFMIEDLMYSVILFVSMLGILLSAMGLYGLISFMAHRHAKTIGIRKVFGASTSSILGIFTKEYAKLMLISFVFAAPISYYLMDVWIQEFAYRISLEVSYFLIGFLVTVILALVTVGYRSFMAARANPVNSLRYE